jgi:HPt (histidine-containing phosphotransfer) domain-containing protein
MGEKNRLSFDLDKALDIVDQDKEFLKELMEIFNSDYPKKVSAIYQAIKEKDFKTLNVIAHGLKGAAGNLFLTKIYELALELEKRGEENKIEGAEEIYKELEKELEKFKEFISQPGWEEKNEDIIGRRY